MKTYMPRFNSFKLGGAIIMMSIVWPGAGAADVDPCTRFKWDVSREMAVMNQTAQAITAALKPGVDVPQLMIGTLYTLKLADQNAVTFVAKPAKSHSDVEARAGLVRFRVEQAGRYRISITSGHWLDVIDGGQAVKAIDFQGHVGCERPRKIVEYELPAARVLTLQLSGSADAQVVMAITAVVVPAASGG
jgi:hypothetical protein